MITSLRCLDLHRQRMARLRDMDPQRFQAEYVRAYAVHHLQWMRNLARTAADQTQDAQVRGRCARLAR